MLVLQFVAGIAMMMASHVGRGIDMYNRGQFEDAEKVFRHVLSQNPKDDTARLYLARTLVSLQRVSEALAEIDRTLSGQPDPEFQFQAGQILRTLAESRFAELEQIAPNSPALHEMAGRRLELKGDLAAALREYRVAADLEPRRPGVHYLIGNILWRMRELDEANATLETELALNSHHAMANFRRGQILIANGENDAALPYLQRAVNAMPESISARRELGKTYRKLGRRDEARREWEAVAKARPDDDQVHYLLGNLYRDYGEEQRAKREFRKHRDIIERRRAAAERR